MDTDVLRIAVCEDLPADAALLESLIENSGFPSERRSFESGEALLRSFAAGRYDLIFLDIYMSGIRGIETAEIIRETDEDVVIAFTTSSPDHTRDSYRLGALKYLDKPVTGNGVRETLELAHMKRKSRPTITLTTAGGKREDILLNDILYFELKDHIVEIHTSAGITKTSQSVRLDDIERRLPCPPFLRCHRSYLVNLNYVRDADRSIHAFWMKNGDRADIRRGGFKKCEEAFKLWLLNKAERF